MRGTYREWSYYRKNCLVRIEGFGISKLISRAHDDGILLRNVRVVSDTETVVHISYEDLKKIRKLAKSKYRITVLDTYGAQERLRRLARKPVTTAGVLCAVIIITVQSMFVCSIRIDGYRAIPEAALLQCLEENGIREGSFIPKIKWSTAEAALKDTFPQLSWVQLVYDGRVILLNVSESHHKIVSKKNDNDLFVPAYEKEDSDGVYCDIVAQKSGYVEDISVLYGEGRVARGDYVKKGQILISGRVPMEATTYEEDCPEEYYVRAKGSVTARVPYRLVFRQERFVRSVCSKCEECENTDEESRRTTVVTDKTEKTQAEAEAVVKQQIRTWAKENLPENAEILNNSLNFSYKKNIIEAGVTLEVLQPIGKDKENIVGETNSDN